LYEGVLRAGSLLAGFAGLAFAGALFAGARFTGAALAVLFAGALAAVFAGALAAVFAAGLRRDFAAGFAVDFVFGEVFRGDFATRSGSCFWFHLTISGSIEFPKSLDSQNSEFRETMLPRYSRGRVI
jgi:hypothetical protein